MKRILYIVSILIMIFTLGLSLPVSAERDLRIGDEVNINGMKATIIDFKGRQPIYESIIYPNIYTSSSDGWIDKSSGVYATARTSITGTVYNSTTYAMVQHDYNGAGTYFLGRAFLYFDTSPFSGYVITAGTVNVRLLSIPIDNDGESIQIQSGMPTYPHDPLVTGDYDLTNYVTDANCGSKDITTFVASSYNSIALDASGLAEINTAGLTKFCLRTTGDIGNIAPTSTNGISYWTSEKGSGYQPYLSVTFTAIAPVIISVAASDIAVNGAQLNSEITDGGGDPNCSVRFWYATTTPILCALPEIETPTIAGYEEGDKPLALIGGLVNDDYYYKVQVKNETGAWVTSATEQTFHTILDVDDMTNFVGYPDDDNISLNWIRADGATNTIIRYALDVCPATTGDGTEIYNDTETSFIHTGLTGGTTYYYSAWGISGAHESDNPLYLTMTTADSLGSSDLPAGTIPSGWYQDPDESFLVNLQPFYSVINGLADTWGMPRGNAWLAISLFFIMICGGGLYIKFHAPALAMMVMALIMAGFVTLHILPSFMLVFVFALALLAWSSRPQGV